MKIMRHIRSSDMFAYVTCILVGAFVVACQFPRTSKELEMGTEYSSCLQLERITEGLVGCLDGGFEVVGAGTENPPWGEECTVLLRD